MVVPSVSVTSAPAAAVPMTEGSVVRWSVALVPASLIRAIVGGEVSSVQQKGDVPAPLPAASRAPASKACAPSDKLGTEFQVPLASAVTVASRCGSGLVPA